MQHLDDGTLHELVDGEIPSARLGPIRAHLDACADCRVRLDEARAMAVESDDLVGVLEVPPTQGRSAGAQERRNAGAQERRSAGSGLGARPPEVAVRSGKSVRRFPVRALAWAASLALAAWLGNRAGRPDLQPVVELPSGPQTALVDSILAGGTTAPSAEEQAAGRDSRLEATAPRTQQDADDRQVGADAPTRDVSAELRRREAPQRANAEEFAAAEAPRPAQEPAAAPPQPLAGRVAERQLGAVGQRSQAKAVTADALEAEAAFVPVEFADAVARLGGAIRLIDGLVPARLEAAGAVVRVVYPLAEGALLLEQWRSGDTLAVRLSGPVSADSLVVLRGRVR